METGQCNGRVGVLSGELVVDTGQGYQRGGGAILTTCIVDI